MNTFKYLASVAAVPVVVLIVATASFRVRAAGSPKPMALQGVMQQLDHDMQAITGAVVMEDWASVVGIAPTIARHPEPPSAQKVRIIAWLGLDAGKFRGFDGQVHDAAVNVGEAAVQGDGEAVIAAFAKVQQGCLGCHRSSRKRFVQHFHQRG